MRRNGRRFLTFSGVLEASASGVTWRSVCRVVTPFGQLLLEPPLVGTLEYANQCVAYGVLRSRIGDVAAW